MAGLEIDEKQRASMLLGIRIAGDFGAVIAIPIVIFALIGRYLDGRYGTNPKFLVAAFIVSALISGKIIYGKAKTYAKEFKEIK